MLLSLISSKKKNKVSKDALYITYRHNKTDYILYNNFIVRNNQIISKENGISLTHYCVKQGNITHLIMVYLDKITVHLICDNRVIDLVALKYNFEISKNSKPESVLYHSLHCYIKYQSNLVETSKLVSQLVDLMPQEADLFIENKQIITYMNLEELYNHNIKAKLKHTTVTFTPEKLTVDTKI